MPIKWSVVVDSVKSNGKTVGTGKQWQVAESEAGSPISDQGTWAPAINMRICREYADPVLAVQGYADHRLLHPLIDLVRDLNSEWITSLELTGGFTPLIEQLNTLDADDLRDRPMVVDRGGLPLCIHFPHPIEIVVHNPRRRSQALKHTVFDPGHLTTHLLNRMEVVRYDHYRASSRLKGFYAVKAFLLKGLIPHSEYLVNQ